MKKIIYLCLTLLLTTGLTLSSSCRTQKPQKLNTTADPSAQLSETNIPYLLKGQFRILKVDKLGYIYLVNAKNEILKLDKNYNLLHSYSINRLGSIKNIDVKNPQKIFVYFDEYATIVYLDNTLSEINRIDLEELGYWDIQGATVARDNNIWLIDYDNLRLIKINEAGQIELSSNEQTEGLAGLRGAKQQLHAKGNQLYLRSNRGVSVYDEFGTYLIHHPIKNDLAHFTDNMIILTDNKTVKTYDLGIQFKEATSILTELETKPVDFYLNRNKLYVIDEVGFYLVDY